MTTRVRGKAFQGCIPEEGENEKEGRQRRQRIYPLACEGENEERTLGTRMTSLCVFCCVDFFSIHRQSSLNSSFLMENVAGVNAGSVLALYSRFDLMR